MSSGQFDFSLAIGGAAGQGIATPGNILARMFTRRVNITFSRFDKKHIKTKNVLDK